MLFPPWDIPWDCQVTWNLVGSSMGSQEATSWNFLWHAPQEFPGTSPGMLGASHAVRQTLTSTIVQHTIGRPRGKLHGSDTCPLGCTSYGTHEASQETPWDVFIVLPARCTWCRASHEACHGRRQAPRDFPRDASSYPRDFSRIPMGCIVLPMGLPHGTSHGPYHLPWEGLREGAWDPTASPVGSRSVPFHVI